MRSARTFPGPWRVEPTEGGHFVVKDATGFSICFTQQLHAHTEAVVIAEAIAKLPDLAAR